MMPPEVPTPGMPATNALVQPFYNADQHPESPKPPNLQWRGILLAGPEQAQLTLRQPLVIVRGHYRISGANYPRDDRLKLIAVDVATKKEYAAAAGQRDPSPEAPPPPSTPRDPAVKNRMVFSGYFNADLAATVSLPWKSAAYRVRAEMGSIVSNEITIQVLVP